MNADGLRRVYERLYQEGLRLGGRRDDVCRRASLLEHVYRHSRQNHVFPLIAAHATLWMGEYSSLAAKLAWWLSWQYGFCPAWRRDKLEAVKKFSAALREINRRICATTYADYRFSARYGSHPAAHEVVDAALLAPLRRVHEAREGGKMLSDKEKLNVFWPHFLHEQQFHVGPGIAAALAELDWPLIKYFALRPIVRFAYFPSGQWLWLSDSLDQRQRAAGGLRSFQAAVQAGWQRTEESLAEYRTVARASGVADFRFPDAKPVPIELS